MKFNILKLSFSIVILSLVINIILSTQTQTQTQSTTQLKTEAKTAAGFTANYKITLGSLFSKTNIKKKIESNYNSQAITDNGNSELGRLSQIVPKQAAGSQIFFKGWIKYFKFTDSNNSKKPKQFFKNLMFEKEARKRSGNPTEKGIIDGIPSPTHFYGILFADNMNIFSTNDKFSSQNIYDVLNIDYIKVIPEDKIGNGGIKDFGKFSEGFCFQVNTVIPQGIFTPKASEAEPKNGLAETWLICTDDLKTKSSLMNLLIKAKIKKQQALGLRIKAKPSIPLPSKNTNTSNNGSNGSSGSNQSLIYLGKPLSIEDLGKTPKAAAKPKDGRWIVLQDWTACNLKCGGGEQTLHLICMPPEKGGKPCEGQAIRKRPCNTQPCPVLTAPISQENKKYEKPIVKVMPMSNRPTRYDKCNLKENDVFVMIKPQGINLLIETKNPNFLGSEAAVKLPARITMNNKSISFYKDENMFSNLLVLDLQSTSFMRISSNDSCFLLYGKLITQQALVCNMGMKPGFVAEWDYDFHLFKNQCSEKRPVIKLNDDMKNKLNAKLAKLKQDLLAEKTQKARQQSQKEEEKKIKYKVDQTQAMTLLALQKENKLERLLEKEEALREGEEEKELELQLEAEQKKKDVLMRSIKEKELEEQFNISKENAENAIKKLKDEAKTAIIKKRDEIKKKIGQMRAKSSRKKAEIKSKIISLRTETAQQLQKYSKKGDILRCFVPNPNSKGKESATKIEDKSFEEQSKHIETVCTASFSSNMSKFMECKLNESFCFICCESEFGQMHLSDRERCYNQRCNKPA